MALHDDLRLQVVVYRGFGFSVADDRGARQVRRDLVGKREFLHARHKLATRRENWISLISDDLVSPVAYRPSSVSHAVRFRPVRAALSVHSD